MSEHEVSSNTCPTCKRPTSDGSVQKFRVPEVPVVEGKEIASLREDVKSLGEKISIMKPTEVNLDKIDQGFKSLDANLTKLAQGLLAHPKPTRDFIANYWEKCEDCSPEWNERKREIQEAALKDHHHVFNEKLIEHFETCKDCHPAWEEMKKKIKTEQEAETSQVPKGKSFWE